MGGQRTENRSPDVIVVGGGAAGCSTALELARRGCTVTLVERDSVGSHASGFAAGGLAPTSGVGIPGPVLSVAEETLKRHADLAVELKDATGIDYGYRPTSAVVVALDETELSELRDTAEWQASQGFDSEILDGDELHEHEPLVVSTAVGGLLQGSHFEVDSYGYTLALATGFEKHGGNIRHGVVSQILASNGSAAGVEFSSGEVLHGGAVVLATGPWAGAGEIENAPALPIRPAKGEMVRLRFPNPDFRHGVSGGGYGAHRKLDGLVWVGTTYEDKGFDERPSFSAQETILASLLLVVPALESAEVVQHTACLRPVSADGLPVIGQAGDLDGLFVVTGAGKKGIFLSPVMGSMAAALVTGRPEEAPIPPEFSPERFE